MAYQAGTPEEPRALVHNISTNIQKLTLLSNAEHTPLTLEKRCHHYQQPHADCVDFTHSSVWTTVWHIEINECLLSLSSSSSPASDLQRTVYLLGTEQDTSQLRHTLWVTQYEESLQYSLSVFEKNDFIFSLVIRQEKQQQGSQLAKETDRLIKAFSALPVSPDQVLNPALLSEVGNTLKHWIHWI